MLIRHAPWNYVLLLCCLIKLQIPTCASEEFVVHEEVPIGTSVGFIADKGRHDKSNYYLEPKDGLFRFHDLKATLVITNRSIDKEELCPYQEICRRTYDVMANSSTYNFRAFLLTRITISIIDINDHTPEFPVNLTRRLVISILESVQPGSRVILPAAEDLDYGPNSNISYSFLTSKTSPSVLMTFALKKHVVDDVSHMLLLTVNDKLDRETEDEYNMTIVASDGGIPSKSSTLDVTVKVEDYNDNAPQFERSYYLIDVYENFSPGEEVFVLKATDADYGENGRLNFAWSEETSRKFGNYFSIDKSGSVKVKSKLDREEQHTFQLTAIVSDSGKIPLSSHTLLTINVKDVNDNAPSVEFKTRNGELSDAFEIVENVPHPVTLGHVTSTDKDQGKNGKVSCAVHPPSFFLLPSHRRNNPSSSSYVEYDIVADTTFDRENTSYHELLVTCKDEGKPQLQTTKSAKITVIDQNDNSPTFDRNVYRVEVEENVGAGTKIFNIKARDLDEGNNSLLTYHLEPQQPKWQNMLKVDEKGDLITINSLDCEYSSQMLFIVRATDAGQPARSGEAGLEVTIKDIDEYIPLFDKTSYEFSIFSKVPENFFIGQVKAVDEDCSTRFGSVLYRLEDTFVENMGQLLYVNKNSGDIRSRVAIDRTRILRFTVVPGNPSGRWFPESKVDVVVRITVDEITKAPPVLIPMFYFPNDVNNSVPVVIGSENGTLVCQLQLTNNSLEKANRLLKSGSKIFRFQILSGNEGGLLSVDEATGWIRTTTTMNAAVQLILNVTAYNSLNPSERVTSQLIIHVNKHDAISSDHSLATAIMDHSILIAILLACSAFLIIFCVTVFVIRCHLSKRKKRPRRYNCRLETVKAASSCSLNRGGYLTPDLNGGTTLKDHNEQNFDTASSLQKFNNRFVSFNVDDDLSCHMTDSRISCPFRDNCSLHKPFVASDFDEISYLNERDFYNLPVFSTQTTSLYNTQHSQPEENQFKSFKPLRTPPIDRPPSTSSGLRQLSPTSFFPITCSGHLPSFQGSSHSGFNFNNNSSNSKDMLKIPQDQSELSIHANRRQSESQI